MIGTRFIGVGGCCRKVFIDVGRGGFWAIAAATMGIVAFAGSGIALAGGQTCPAGVGSPAGCTANCVNADINTLTVSAQHGEEVCYTVTIFNGGAPCCDVAGVDANFFIGDPDGPGGTAAEVVYAITNDAYVARSDTFTCPGPDPRCITPGNCTPPQVGYRYFVNHTDEHGVTGDSCPPTPVIQFGGGQISAYAQGSGTLCRQIQTGASLCKSLAINIPHGACCEPCSGTCTDGVSENECPAPSVFTPGATSATAPACLVTCPGPIPPCEAGQVCDPSTGLCTDLPDAPLSTPCVSDTNICTTDHCDGNGECVRLSTSCDVPDFCDDANVCTTDRCSIDLPTCCENTPDDCPLVPCFRNTGCDPITGCIYVPDCRTGPLAECCPDDGNECTTESCNLTTGLCESTSDCETDDECEETPPDLCTIDTCDDSCCLHDPLCLAGSVCCANNAGICQDGLLCTVDSCEDPGCCEVVPLCAPGTVCCADGALCNDNNACTIDNCVNGCCGQSPRCPDNGVPGTQPGEICCAIDPAVCQDGLGCTDDACANGCCTRTNHCAPGIVCCADGASCEDGDPCTTDSCVNGCCTHGSVCADPDFCNDDDDCTSDSCVNDTNPATACCINEPEVPCCGNNIVEPGETCDPPGSITPEGLICTDICRFCGDGNLDPGEECEIDIPCFAHDKPCKETVCNDQCLCIKVPFPNGTIVTTDNVCLDLVCQGGMPIDQPKPAGANCGVATSQGPCDAADSCDGKGHCNSNFSEAHVVCRPAANECDKAEKCSGINPGCPADLCAPAGTLATDDGEECTYDVCNGQCSAVHPPRPFRTPCGNPNEGTCDLPDQCNGYGQCDMNLVATGNLCRAARAAKLGECIRGPNAGYPHPSCFTVDMNQDGDVDLQDCEDDH